MDSGGENTPVQSQTSTDDQPSCLGRLCVVRNTVEKWQVPVPSSRKVNFNSCKDDIEISSLQTIRDGHFLCFADHNNRLRILSYSILHRTHGTQQAQVFNMNKWF